ncbi:MAG: PEGA domain-containing protein [Deferribacteres bacterium]|nr:PEGA domain-containing protein [Deferribacteres bacterium]
MSENKKPALLISAYAIALLLIAGCASVRGPVYTGRTIFIPVQSSPEGARVLLDGEFQGLTPVTVRISYISSPSGDHEDETRQRVLRIEKPGYEPFVLSFSIKGREYEKLFPSISLKKTVRAKDKKDKKPEQQDRKPRKTAPSRQAVVQKIYTIQAGSFTKAGYARKQFDYIAQKLNEKELAYLRIEKVGEFYSVRLGRFKDYRTARRFLQAIKTRLPGVIIVRSYIRPDRIIKTFKDSTAP